MIHSLLKGWDMMKKQFFVIAIVLLFFIISLCGCNEQQKGNDDTSKFIGTWRYIQDDSTESLWTFYYNGSVGINLTTPNFSYVNNGTIWEKFELKNNKLCLFILLESGKKEYNDCLAYEFFNDYNSVKFTNQDGTTRTFNKI